MSISFLKRRRPPRSTRTDTLFPYTTLVRAKLVHGIEEIANAKSVTPSQLVLAWLLAQGEDIVPIPGTKRKRSDEHTSELQSLMPISYAVFFLTTTKYHSVNIHTIL